MVVEIRLLDHVAADLCRRFDADKSVVQSWIHLEGIDTRRLQVFWDKMASLPRETSQDPVIAV
jgi:cell division FtsZ-interacting protein ZapD